MAKPPARKKPTPSPKPVPAGGPAARLAAIDADLLKLVQQRASLVAEADAVLLDAEPARLGTLIDAGEGPLPPRIVRAIFREIQSGCRALVRAAADRLPRAALQLQPPGRHPPFRPQRAVGAGGDHFRGL